MSQLLFMSLSILKQLRFPRAKLVSDNTVWGLHDAEANSFSPSLEINRATMLNPGDLDLTDQFLSALSHTATVAARSGFEKNTLENRHLKTNRIYWVEL